MNISIKKNVKANFPQDKTLELYLLQYHLDLHIHLELLLKKKHM